MDRYADKEVREIAKRLEAQGWQLVKGKGHTKAYPPDPSKPMVVLPGTPGRGRWKANLIAQPRRSGADL